MRGIHTGRRVLRWRVKHEVSIQRSFLSYCGLWVATACRSDNRDGYTWFTDDHGQFGILPARSTTTLPTLDAAKAECEAYVREALGLGVKR